MRRREFIAGLGGVAASPAIWPSAARAQQGGRPRRVGVLQTLLADDSWASFDVRRGALIRLIDAESQACIGWSARDEQIAGIDLYRLAVLV
jgi:hypothetical protein